MSAGRHPGLQPPNAIRSLLTPHRDELVGDAPAGAVEALGLPERLCGAPGFGDYPHAGRRSVCERPSDSRVIIHQDHRDPDAGRAFAVSGATGVGAMVISTISSAVRVRSRFAQPKARATGDNPAFDKSQEGRTITADE